ncbi:MAG: hypothetical protein ACPGGK_08565 [Pikeienuella sp.]
MELHQIIQTAFQFWLAALAAMVGLRLLQARINVRGMLSDRNGGPPSADRLALMAITIGGAVFYFVTALKAPGTEMVAPPDELLFLLGGSQAAYLTGKSFRIGGG